MSDSLSNSIESMIQKATSLPPVEAASFLGRQPQMVIVEVLSALPQEQVLEIASHLPGVSSQGYEDNLEIAEDIKGTVRELMTKPIGVLRLETTVAGALDHIVHTTPASEITYIYVIDGDDKLVGVVVMRDLLLAKPGQTLADIMTCEPFVLTTDTTINVAIQAALQRHYRLYPVVDEQGSLVGLIQGWKLFERVASEISAQSGAMVGVDREERVTTPFFQSFRMRHPWLQVNLLTAFAAAFIVGLFEDTITQIVALAVFLPVLAGQSGNTGCQALAITLRGLTLGDLRDYPVGKLVRKEMMLGAMNGFLVGLIAALAMGSYAAVTGSAQPVMLALVILLAMTGACIGSGIFGVLVPLILRRFGADPATASSIFLTTFTDIIGMGLMLFLATVLVL